MDILRGCAETLFCKIPYENADISGNKEVFCKYASTVFPQYTDDEIEHIFEYAINDKLNGVFDVIFKIGNRFLTKNLLNEVTCRENEALRWRDISFKLGQDIFVTAFLANCDFTNQTTTEVFTWSPVIKMENKILQDIQKDCNKGFPDNHFHLNGSTQIFPLSFACVMNNIVNRQKQFRKIRQHLQNNSDYCVKTHTKKSLYGQCIIAAALRLYLFCKCKGEIEIFAETNINCNDLLNIDGSQMAELQRLINICKYQYGYYDNDNYKNLCLDYAYCQKNEDQTDNKVLAGERNFLYDCFLSILKNKLTAIEKHYLYTYLIIKNRFRQELVQTNERIGFKNFSNYQDRKEYFIDGYKQYEHALIRLAINSTLSGKMVKSIEARICPKNKSAENIRMIRNYDKIVSLQKEEKEDYKNFYVMHFPKSKDKKPYEDFMPRHFQNRLYAMRRSRAIVSMLERNNSLRERMRGIDACSNEIGCRPEVFASCFRYLMNTQIRNDNLPTNDKKEVQCLNATYHVGEDFLDIADGLRAIDEAITYFDLKKGNRLGHAIALGINADGYYGKKKNQLIMNKQDALDNIAWLIGKVKDFNIGINKDIYEILERQYYKLLKDIYTETNIKYYDYYNSWKLRGDEPELYFTNNITSYIESIYDSRNFLITTSISNEIRDNTIYRELYYRYHYDVDAKKKGNEKYIFKVDENYINLIKSIQYEMQKYVKKLGLAIETNPSSNYLIGPIEKYDEHPIFKFFDINNTSDSNISVSINTDDQGVFETSLQNEYSLLSLSLRKNGKNYNEEKIKDFIESVKQLSWEQIFK